MGEIKRCPPNCPNRSIEPNCHTTCEIYKDSLEEFRKIKERKKADAEYTAFKRKSVADTIKYLHQHRMK